MKRKKNKPTPPAPTNFIKPAVAPPPSRPRWAKRCLIGLVIYTVVGFFVLPAVVKWQLRKQLPAFTHRVAEVKQVRMNPYALSLTIRGLSLTETNGMPFVAFDELYVNFQLSSVFRGAWTFGDIWLVHPTANLVRLAEGGFNFSNLAGTNSAPASATNPPTAPPAILVQSFLITNAVVTFADETTAPRFKADYGPINLAVTDFTTRRAKDGPYTFVATTTDGESFAWSGRISANPPQSSGQFKLTGITPAKYAAYLAQSCTVQVASGKIAMSADYRVNAASSPLELDVTNATFQITDLLLKPPGSDTTLLGLNQFTVTNTYASLTGHVARVGSVALVGGSALLEREADGSLTTLKYLLRQTSQAASVAALTNTVSESTAPWRFDLAELDISGFAVSVKDHSTPTLAELGVDDLHLNVKGFSTETNTPVDVALAFNWRGGGAVSVKTRGTLMPPDITATLGVSDLALSPLQPYIGQHLNLVVHSGGLSVDGEAKFNPTAQSRIHFAGNVGITNFASSDTVSYHELANWKNLAVRGIDFSLQTNNLVIEEVKFTEARNNFVISSNGVLNVSALQKTPVRSDAPPSATPATNAPAAEPFPIRVVALVLENNSVHVADDSLPNRFQTSIEEFSGVIRNIVLPGANKAGVDIHGKVSALSPFEISGEVTPDPKNLFVNLKVAFTNTDLTPLSPFTEKFIGRPINKGKLNLDLRYNIEQRALKAENIVTLDRFTFGAKNDSPDATKLPVKLAVGLLKDIHGRIDLNLPIEGSLDDPQFSIWGIVGGVFKNLILKVATSPFSLLGSLVGGGDDMQFVEFAPGNAALSDSQTNKLVKLSMALTNRPALSVEIGATFDPVTDTDSLGRQKVMERMKLAHIQQLVASGKPAPALEQLKLEDGDYNDLLRAAYKTAFNTTPERALREALAAAAATNSLTDTALETASTQSTEQTKGASRLMREGKSLAQLAAQAARGNSSSINANAKPKTERELVRDELETRLLTLSPVTADDLRLLMQQRVEAVQKFLLDVGKIEGERLTPVMRSPEDSSSKGQARVIFSLD